MRVGSHRARGARAASKQSSALERAAKSGGFGRSQGATAESEQSEIAEWEAREKSKARAKKIEKKYKNLLTYRKMCDRIEVIATNNNKKGEKLL